jgi:radical SAM superfamily enzyme YgiQ (UPF0313 family)
MRVLLISPNTLVVPYPVYPLGLDYVAGSIAECHEVKIIDLNVVGLNELEGVVLDYNPQIIGISCRNIDNTDVSDSQYFVGGYASLVSWLRSCSKAVIVCGGAGFTIMPEQVLAALGADFGIIGEGERFGLLVDAIANGENPENIAGVISAATAAATATPEPWQGDRSRAFHKHVSHRKFYIDHGGMLNLQSKRGCAFQCIYCPYPAIEGKKHRMVDADEVAGMALDLQEAGAKYFFITDSAFNSDIDHSLAVAKSLKKAGVTIPWGGFFAPVKLPLDYYSILADAGLSHVEFGTESLSNTILKSYRKPFRVDDVYQAHEQALAAGLHVAHYFLMGGPGESAMTITETLDNMKNLEKTVLFFFFGIRIYPQTGLYDIALAEGKITPETNLLEPVFYEPDDIDLSTIETLVTDRVGKKINCVVGSGGSTSAATVARMHERGYVGPLWEYLIR